MNSHHYTDPTYIGPGTWNVIHTLAFNAKTKHEQLETGKIIKLICFQFPCKICKGHAKNYIKENSMTKSINKLKLFYWTWKFHNYVNFRLKKSLMPYEVAYKIYDNLKDDKEVCSKCSN